MKRRALGIAFLLLATLGVAQDDVHIVPRIKRVPDPVIQTHDQSTIKVQVNLALVPVVVTDDRGNPFVGLVKDHFRLWEHGKEQDIRYFSEDDAPVSIGLIFDRSGSMGWKIDNAKAVIHSFAKQVNPDDEIFLITFADTVDSTDFQSVSDEIDSRLLFMQSKGRTSLLDAVYYGLNKMKDAKYQRRALVIVSDGGDNHSRYTEKEVERVVEEADVQVFSIALVNRECMAFMNPNNPCSTEERQGPFLLEELAHKGGGVSYLLDNPVDIEHAIDTIGQTLRQEYILGFNPHCKQAQYHKLKVKLNRLPKGVPLLRVDVKNGFYTSE